jgi:hypothetical protein
MSKAQMETLLNRETRVSSIWNYFDVYWLLILKKMFVVE